MIWGSPKLKLLRFPYVLLMSPSSLPASAALVAVRRGGRGPTAGSGVLTCGPIEIHELKKLSCRRDDFVIPTTEEFF